MRAAGEFRDEDTTLGSYTLHAIIPESPAMTIMAMPMIDGAADDGDSDDGDGGEGSSGNRDLTSLGSACKVFTMMVEKTPRWRRPCQNYPRW